MKRQQRRSDDGNAYNLPPTPTDKIQSSFDISNNDSSGLAAWRDKELPNKTTQDLNKFPIITCLYTQILTDSGDQIDSFDKQMTSAALKLQSVITALASGQQGQARGLISRQTDTPSDVRR